MTAPYGTIDNTNRVQLSQHTMMRTGVIDTALPTKSSKIPGRKIRKAPMKKVSLVIDVQKNNQFKYSFTGDTDTDSRACFIRSTWNLAVNLQQPPLGTTVMAFGVATIAQLFRMVELMNPRRIPNIMILIGTNNVSRGSDEEEALWESMMVCLF